MILDVLLLLYFFASFGSIIMDLKPTVNSLKMNLMLIYYKLALVEHV